MCKGALCDEGCWIRIAIRNVENCVRIAIQLGLCVCVFVTHIYEEFRSYVNGRTRLISMEWHENVGVVECDAVSFRSVHG